MSHIGLDLEISIKNVTYIPENTVTAVTVVTYTWIDISVQWLGEDHSHSAGPPASVGGRTAVILSGRGSFPSAGLAGLLDYTVELHKRETETL